MAHWDQDFDFYMAQIEGEPASFVIDLNAPGHAPVATHPLLLGMRVPLLRPRPDGLRDEGEREIMGEIEDQIVERIEAALDGIYVGRFVSGGATELFAYVPAAHRATIESDLTQVTGALPAPYALELRIEDDAEWGHCIDFLAPDAVARQTIWNRRLVHQFAEMGDALHVPREVDHLVTFPDRESAEVAATALRALGFRTDEITQGEPPTDDEISDDDDDDEDNEAGVAPSDDDLADEDETEEQFRLELHRSDALAGDRPDEFVGEILDVILPLGGDYDGWGAGHVRASDAPQD